MHTSTCKLFELMGLFGLDLFTSIRNVIFYLKSMNTLEIYYQFVKVLTILYKLHYRIFCLVFLLFIVLVLTI